MIVGMITGATRNLGAPRNWEPQRHGSCGGLPIRDEMHAPGLPRMVSAWLPTPDELDRLLAGAAVHLVVIGCDHPPVAMLVGDAPSAPAADGAHG